MNDRPALTADERARYAWQLDVPGFGEDGQRRLKAATVLVSRAGGVGGLAAFQLAAAGVGRIILAHGGDLRPDDLNRQLLMTTAGLGRPRVESAAATLRALNPHVEVVVEPANIGPGNVARLTAQADCIIDAAPLFEERYLLNRAALDRGLPMVEAAMHGLELTITTIRPGRTACLRCLAPERPAWWTRRFPVFGAVSGTAGCLAAMEAIKVLAGLGDPLAGRLLHLDLAAGTSRVLRLRRDPACPDCAPRP